ncbi:hypothetical protein [uncultured Ilyobacter sp.]|uniref:hypothetical protein n=1 Tax=uncultured Ilyobacter sp. TaxID=544433 RepID=UPI0029C64D17|nr:hypothetical protein [uncultured Ilyobacter sp.]
MFIFMSSPIRVPHTTPWGISKYAPMGEANPCIVPIKYDIAKIKTGGLKTLLLCLLTQNINIFLNKASAYAIIVIFTKIFNKHLRVNI